MVLGHSMDCDQDDFSLMKRSRSPDQSGLTLCIIFSNGVKYLGRGARRRPKLPKKRGAGQSFVVTVTLDRVIDSDGSADDEGTIGVSDEKTCSHHHRTAASAPLIIPGQDAIHAIFIRLER